MPQRKRVPRRAKHTRPAILALGVVVIASMLLIELYAGPRPVRVTGSTALEEGVSSAPMPPWMKSSPPSPPGEAARLAPVASAIPPWKATAANTPRPPAGYLPLWSVPSPAPDRSPPLPAPTPPPDPSAHRPPDDNPHGVDDDRPPRPR
jgi:hypothetical protein